MIPTTDFSLDFVGIGAAKAGTSWVSVCLAEHPQVCMSRRKELMFFCRKTLMPHYNAHYDLGLQWLYDGFPHWQPGQLRGESSNAYSYDPESPMLIHRHFPQTRIIINMREPVDRLYAFYYHVIREYPVPDTFEAFLEAYPQFLDTGYYYHILKRYNEYFDWSQIHCILFDDICNSPETVVADLYSFLGIESSFQPTILHQRINERKTPRSKLLRNLFGYTKRWFASGSTAMRFKALLRRMAVLDLAEWVQERNMQVTNFPPMHPDTRNRLRAHYAEYNCKLGEFLGCDLSHWNQ
jgi:hypothetical protein